MGKYIVTVENRWDNLSLNHGRVLIVEIVSSLSQGLADHQLMERDEIFLVVVDCWVLFNFFELFLDFNVLGDNELLELGGQLKSMLGDLHLYAFLNCLKERCPFIGSGCSILKLVIHRSFVVNLERVCKVP